MALIWAFAFAGVCICGITLIGRPLRQALEAITKKHVTLEAEAAAKLDAQLVELGERRHQLLVSQGSLEEEVASRREQLRRDAAQARIDAEAAKGALEAAVEARRAALRARGEAEAALAPEFLRAEYEASLRPVVDWGALARMYESYCARKSGPWSVAQWLQGLEIDLSQRTGRLPISDPEPGAAHTGPEVSDPE